MKITITTLMLAINAFISFSQVIELPKYSASITSIPYYGRETPFWLISNNQGKFLPHDFNNLLEVHIHSPLKDSNKFSIGYGADLINRYAGQNKAYINQAYVESKIFFVHMLAGTKNKAYGNQDPTLSSGGLLYSGNARPMPKLSIGTDGFVPIPFTKGLIEVDAYLEHGWFENNRDGWMDSGRHVSNVLYHHKHLSGRIGGNLPVHFTWGFYHFAQWAGKLPGQEVAMSSDLDAYWRVFMVEASDSTGSIASDIKNKAGNHIGGRMIGLEAELKKMDIHVYWQTIFDDGSGLKWQNIQDGLWGVSIKLKDKKQFISGLCFEYLHTTMQSGLEQSETLGLRGNDNYFNNYTYHTGWSYYGFTLGNPFITSPIIEEGDERSFVNNKVIVSHYGFEGNIYKDINYKLLFSFHDNFGTNDDPYWPPKDHLSALLAVDFPINVLGGLHVSTQLGVDAGAMYGDNIGLMISIIKRGTFTR